MEIAEIKKSYQRKQRLYKTKQDNLRKDIKKAEENVQELKEKERKMTYPHHHENYLKPLAEELLKHFKNRTYDILGPFGLYCESSIHLYKNGVDKNELFDGDNCISVTFKLRHGDNNEPYLVLVDHLHKHERYPNGSLGEMNGGNYETVLMKETIYELVKFIKEQNKKKDKKLN